MTFKGNMLFSMLHGIYTSPSEGSDMGEIFLSFVLDNSLSFPGQGVGLTGQSLYGFELVFYEPINTEVNNLSNSVTTVCSVIYAVAICYMLSNLCCSHMLYAQ